MVVGLTAGGRWDAEVASWLHPLEWLYHGSSATSACNNVPSRCSLAVRALSRRQKL